VAHPQPLDLLADDRRVDVEERGDVEATGGEPLRVRQGAPEIADAHHGDRPVLVDPEGPLDLGDEELGS
jgi:hypothetical protein